MKVYIAGKITGDPDYKAKFQAAADQIAAMGNVVLNPAVQPAGLTMADYMRTCFAMIDSADLVVFLPDWKESRGAKIERALCEYTKKVYSDIEELIPEKGAAAG